MFRAPDALKMKHKDVLKLLAAGTHLGGNDLDFKMVSYIYRKKKVIISTS